MDLLDSGEDVLELASKLPGSQQALLAAYQELVNKRHQAWEQYQAAHLMQQNSANTSDQFIVSEAGLTKTTLGDAIRAGQQQRIITRWEKQQQRWAATEAVLAARVGKASIQDLAMSRGQEWRRQQEAVQQLEAASSAACIEVTPGMWSMTLRGSNERLLPLGNNITSGLYVSKRDPYKAGRQLEFVGRPSATSLSNSMHATSSGRRTFSASTVGALQQPGNSRSNSASSTTPTARASNSTLAPLALPSLQARTSGALSPTAASGNPRTSLTNKGIDVAIAPNASISRRSVSPLSSARASKMLGHVARPSSARSRGYLDSQYLQTKKQQLHVEQQAFVPDVDSLMVQGTAAENLLLAAATRPISLYEIEEQLSSMDEQAYQHYMLERHDLDTSVAGDITSATNTPRSNSQTHKGPWLRLGSNHILLDAAVGSTACAEVALCNIGTTVVYYHWQQEEKQQYDNCTKPDARCKNPSNSSAVVRPTEGIHSPDLSTARCAILPGEQKTVRLMFKPTTAGVFTQCWTLVTAPQLMASVGQLVLRGYATADDIMSSSRKQLAVDLEVKQRTTQVHLAIQVILDRVAVQVHKRATAKQRCSSAAVGESIALQLSLFQSSNAAEWPPVYYRADAWSALQALHTEVTTLMTKANLAVPAALPQPGGATPTAVCIASEKRKTAATGEQQEPAAPPPQPAAAPPPSNSHSSGNMKHNSKQVQQQAQQQQEAPPPDQPSYAGSLQYLRLMLQQVAQPLEQETKAHEAAVQKVPVLQRRLDYHTRQLQVPGSRQEVLRYCLAGILSELADRVAAGAQVAGESSSSDLLSEQSSHSGHSVPHKVNSSMSVAAGQAAGSASKPQKGASGAAVQQKGQPGASSAAPAALRAEPSHASLEMQQKAQYMQRFRKQVRQGAVELLGRLEEEVLLVQQAASEQVQQLLEGPPAMLPVLAGVSRSGTSGGTPEERAERAERAESEWRAFALLRCLQRSKVV